MKIFMFYNVFPSLYTCIPFIHETIHHTDGCKWKEYIEITNEAKQTVIHVQAMLCSFVLQIIPEGGENFRFLWICRLLSS